MRMRHSRTSRAIVEQLQWTGRPKLLRRTHPPRGELRPRFVSLLQCWSFSSHRVVWLFGRLTVPNSLLLLRRSRVWQRGRAWAADMTTWTTFRRIQGLFWQFPKQILLATLSLEVFKLIWLDFHSFVEWSQALQWPEQPANQKYD